MRIVVHSPLNKFGSYVTRLAAEAEATRTKEPERTGRILTDGWLPAVAGFSLAPVSGARGPVGRVQALAWRGQLDQPRECPA